MGSSERPAIEIEVGCSVHSQMKDDDDGDDDDELDNPLKRRRMKVKQEDKQFSFLKHDKKRQKKSEIDIE